MSNLVEYNLEVLEAIKEDNGIKSDAEFARRLGVGRPLINQIKSGRRKPSAFMISRFFTEFQIAFDPFANGGLYQLTKEEESRIKNLSNSEDETQE